MRRKSGRGSRGSASRWSGTRPSSSPPACAANRRDWRAGSRSRGRGPNKTGTPVAAPRCITIAVSVGRTKPMTQDELLALRKQPAFAAGELTERIIAEKQGSIGWLTFNNPARRNAISIDMWEAIPKVLDRFERDSEVRVIVLKGEGDKAFVSGADVSQYEKDRSTAEGIQRYEEIAGRVAERLQTCA